MDKKRKKTPSIIECVVLEEFYTHIDGERVSFPVGPLPISEALIEEYNLIGKKLVKVKNAGPE